MKAKQETEVDDMVDLKNRLEAKEFIMKLYSGKSKYKHETFLMVYLNSSVAYFDELQEIVNELKGYDYDGILVSFSADRCGDYYLTVDIDNIRKKGE